MHNCLRIIILLLVVTFSSAAIGQINFKHGYIITNTDDTIQGKINDGGAARNAKVCVFKARKSRKTVKYHPGDIKAYRMTNDKYYASKVIEINDHPKAVFLEVVVKGEVNLYHHWKNGTMAYYIEKDNQLLGLFNEEGLLHYKPDEDILLMYGPSYILRNRAYLDTLRYVFKDSKAITDRVEMVKYKETALANVTKDYILEKCKGDHCISYERFHKMYKPTFGLYGGVRFNQFEFYGNYYSKSVKSNVFKSYPVGLFFNFPLHLLSDKISLQVELLANSNHYQQDFTNYSYLNTNKTFDISFSTIGLPLLLKYEIGNGKIRPTIAVGREIAYAYQSDVTIDNTTDLKIHHTQNGGWLGEIGVNYQLARRFSVFANLRVQRNNNLIIKDEYQSSNYKTLKDKMSYDREYTNLFSTVLVGLEF